MNNLISGSRNEPWRNNINSRRNLFLCFNCMDQIAEELNVTGERARQLVRQAENALRALPGIELLEQYK